MRRFLYMNNFTEWAITKMVRVDEIDNRRYVRRIRDLHEANQLCKDFCVIFVSFPLLHLPFGKTTLYNLI